MFRLCCLSYRFILSALSASQRNVVNCALCHRALPVFEQFPLVDGTLFLSPSRHDEIEYDVPCHLQGQTLLQFWFSGRISNYLLKGFTKKCGSIINFAPRMHCGTLTFHLTSRASVLSF